MMGVKNRPNRKLYGGAKFIKIKPGLLPGSVNTAP